eukprot:TRINITY_DN37885_c0_g1_i1.p1 TRINITY_DN37885_c0_g1~~TRINITY_DN37885_c0_g1_i1.p1  ORF type:complete len:110 (+),score=9.58 TRINITY_DN37885_c0_g1_i1:94-423(+)
MTEPQGVVEQNMAHWGELKTSDLGAFGCCDCCHTSGLNCGPKFPHGTHTSYLFLTPRWCSSLTRLAYDLSDQAIQAVTDRNALTQPWEDILDSTAAPSRPAPVQPTSLR